MKASSVETIVLANILFKWSSAVQLEVACKVISINVMETCLVEEFTTLCD